MIERRDPATGELLETVDLVPKILAYVDSLLNEYLGENPNNAKHILLCLRTLIVCITHMIDEYVNVRLDIKDHASKTTKITGIRRSSIYNYNKEYRKIPPLERLSKFWTPPKI